MEQTLRAAGQDSGPLCLSVLLNISRSYYELENYDRAAEYFRKVAAEDPTLVEQYSYLQTGEETGKAAAVGALGSVIFAGEDE